MRIDCVGGGPAGLYFAILMKKQRPEARIRVFERNRPDDTFGWGVVFSDETLGNFGEADPESYAAIRRDFIHWDAIDTHYRGSRVRSSGHGFSGLARVSLLQILHERCRELGVELRFQEEVDTRALEREADLVVAADGIHSPTRESRAAAFRPSLDWRSCRFTWLGTTKPLGAFTFLFLENEHGLWMIHAYPFRRPDPSRPDLGVGTWIVETHDDTWHRAGLEGADDAATVAYCEKLCAEHLDGHRLLANRSIWRRFPNVSCERWHDGKVVLLGDAAHSAHFSIGSGTKLAMEDAIALAEAFRASGDGPPEECVPRALETYQEARYVETLKIQKAAQTSLEWFENARRYLGQSPERFTFNLMTRSKRITWENLRRRDPELVRRAGEAFAAENGQAPEADGELPPPMFTPLTLRGLTLANRVVVSPMCQYSAVDGAVNDWHLVHLGARIVGGAGLVLTEMTDVSAEGRITHGCAGLYDPAHLEAWRRIVAFGRAHGKGALGIQLAHAGRKASFSRPWEGDRPLEGPDAWQAIGPSPEPFRPGWPVPREMDRVDMQRVIAEFVRATQWADELDFDLVELHMAHGYLLSSFLSPAANRRADEYGGSLENRMRFPLEVFDAVRAVWPERKPLAVRISATDWLEERAGAGTTLDESVALARELAGRGCDLIDVSSAGNTPESKPVYGRMYQVPFAERIRHEVGLPVLAVGAIQGPDHVNTILAAGRADLCALARPHLLDPHLTLRAAADANHGRQHWPPQDLAVRPRPRRAPGS